MEKQKKKSTKHPKEILGIDEVKLPSPISTFSELDYVLQKERMEI